MSQQLKTKVVVRRLLGASLHELQDINTLLPQLSKSSQPLSYEQFTEVVQAEANRVYVGIAEDGRIVGVMLLVVVQQLVGVKCWIEDVVVDQKFRRQGIAEAMMLKAIKEAPVERKSIDLTSNPQRAEARKLYGGLGFEVRDTGVFRLSNPAHL